MAVIKIKTIKNNLQAVINYGKNGDKYQVVICTHINKENVHNHLILNSVSFIDGKKYHNSNSEIAFMKEASDNLCIKYRLSLVNTPRAEKERAFRQNHIDYFNRRDEKMQKIISDIDEAIKTARRYSDFKLTLKTKGYVSIKDTGKYLSLKTPYYSRNVRIDRAFGERYSVQRIKERIYYKEKEKIPVVNLNKKYYRKIYTGPKINKFLLQTSSFYRLYVHYLYFFGKLPAKNHYTELTPEYYKQKRKNNMIFEEINFLATNSFKSVKEVGYYMDNLEKQLPKLKGKRELLWKKHKTADENNKTNILKEINALTNKIDIIQAQKRACNRIIDKFDKIKEDYKSKEKSKELIITDKMKRLRNR